MTGREKYIQLENLPYQVWTKKVGDGPISVLTLTGGPGLPHDYLEPFEKYLPPNGFSFYYYDQLGTGNSSKPDDVSLWTIERSVDEVEQVRKGLGLEQFVLYGQSWGGILAMEYAIKYPGHLQGVIISNMTASIESYMKYLNVLRGELSPEDQAILKKYEEEKNYHAPEYEAVVNKLNQQHLCRVPMPECAQRADKQWNRKIYVTSQGENEFVVTGNQLGWDRWKDLPNIKAPTLLLVGKYDTMSPADMTEMKNLIPDAQITICPNGSHLCLFDDEKIYFASILNFLNGLKLKNTEIKTQSNHPFFTVKTDAPIASAAHVDNHIKIGV